MKNNDLRNLLGLNQNDMATLLGVSRSHYSMYELGKRDLPLTATQLLAELLTALQAAQKSSKATKHDLIAAQAKNQQLLQSLLRENEYQRLKTERELTALQNKPQIVISPTEIAKIVKMATAKTATADPNIASILAKTSKPTQKNLQGDLLKLKIKLEVLTFEKERLELARQGQSCISDSR